MNAGAALVPIGALANMLWWRIARDEGLDLSVRRYLSITVPVIVPALGAAIAVLAEHPNHKKLAIEVALVG